MVQTENDYKDIIGTTFETYDNITEQRVMQYHHKQELVTVKGLMEKMNISNFDQIIDLGCSDGSWYNDFKSMGFKKLIGIELSTERAEKARKRGYDEVFNCNAKKTPITSDSTEFIISNNAFVHILQDEDKIQVLNEIRRVLSKNGVFIMNFANSTGYGHKKNTTVKYISYITLNTMKKLVQESGLKIEHIVPCYYRIPRIGANPKLAKFFTKVIFPCVDRFLKSVGNRKNAKVIYLGLRKIN